MDDTCFENKREKFTTYFEAIFLRVNNINITQ